MMPAAKHLDIVTGIDIHVVMIPSPAGPIPTPLPHPFIGIVMDPMDYVPIMGATVLINGLPRAQAGTGAKAIPPHIPMGGPFLKPPSSEGEMFMGSATVLVDGEPFTYLGLPVLTCNDFGMPPPPRSKKKGGFKSLELPTSVVMPIPAGRPVLVGGPPTISMMAMGMKLGMAAMGKLFKKIKGTKLAKKLSDKIHDAAAKAMDKLKIPKSVRDKVHKAICSVTGHPVDIASGMVFTETVDFELSGPIPLIWERTWYSTSDFQGQLGHGWHNNYDMALAFEHDPEGASIVVVRMADGRPAIFEDIEIGESRFNRTEKLTLFRDEKGYFVRDKSLLNYYFEKNIDVNKYADGKLLEEKDADTEGVFLLSKIADLNGNTIQFQHTNIGHLTNIIDSTGRNLKVVTDEKGRITSIIAPHPQKKDATFEIVRYQYDRQGNLIQSLDAHEQAMTYIYQGHLLVKETNRNGLSFHFQYDGTTTAAKCLRTWGDGGIYDHKLTYHDGFTIVENSLGAKATHFHKGGLVYKEINTKGGETLKHYNEFNDLMMEQDPLGLLTTYNYDDRANTTGIVTPDGAATQIVYNDLDLPVTMTDPVGGQWIWAYDDKGNPTLRLNPLKELTKYAYTEGGQLAEIEDAKGGKTTLYYDDFKNLVTARTADGQSYNWQYDILSNCTSARDPKGNMQRRTFDLLSQVTQVEEPDGNTRVLKYDPEGNIIYAKDEQYTVRFEYGGMNRLKARTQNNTRVEFKYDTEERLLGIINEHGYAYRFDLDTEGDVVRESGFDGLRRIYERDAAGRVTKVKRPNKMETHYAYDGVGRVTTVLHSDGAAEKFTYRADGALMMAQNEAAAVSFERDVLGRVLSETTNGHKVTSAYDILGFRSSVKSSLGADLDFKRNIMGDVESLKANDFTANFKRDILGLELERNLSGGVQGRWTRDSLGRPIKHELKGTGGTTHRIRTYNWDINDRLKQITDSTKGTTKYEHDNFGNLSASISSDGTIDLRMPDAVGNLFRDKNRRDRSYGPAGQLLEANGVSYEYDAEGNLSKKIEKRNSVWHYAWNASGMLEHVKRPDGNVVTMRYDALGRRISKQFDNNITKWVWDGNVPLHEWKERAAFYTPPMPMASGRVALQMSAALAVADVTTWVFEADSFSPLAKLTPQGNFGIITDHLGTPLSMFDEKGGSVWSADLNIYGEIRNLRGDAEDCPFRYPGQYEDVETGLYYNRFRYYDAEMGGYLSQDPIGLAGGLSIYAYVNDPLIWIDMFGLTKSCGPKFNPNKKFKYSKGGKMSVMKHILQRHRAKTLYEDVSKFSSNSPKQIQKLINDAIKNGNVDKASKSVTATFSRNIGTDINGNATKKIQIFFDEKGWVRTAFPL